MENQLTPENRPRTLWVLMGLEMANGLCGLLWPAFFPLLPLSTPSSFATNRPMAIILVIAFLSLFHLIVAGGLWKRQQWAFRLGVNVTVFILGIDLFLLFLALLEHPAFDGGAGCELLLTSAILCCFLRSEVIRTVMGWKR